MFFRKKCSKNCIVCANGLNLMFWAPLGLASFKASCKHYSNRNEIKFENSKRLYVTSILIACFIIGTCIFDLNTHVGQSKVGVNYLIRILTDSFYCINAVIQIIIALVNTNLRIKIYRDLTNILQKSDSFGIGDLLPLKKVVKYKKISIAFISQYLIKVFLMIILFRKDFFLFSVSDISKIIVSGICFYLDLGVLFGYLIELCLIKTIYKECFNKIVEELNSKKKSFVDVTPRVIINQKNLISFRLIYADLMEMHKSFKLYSEKQIFFWILFGTITMILNIYLVLKATIDGAMKNMNVGHLVLEARIFMTTVIALVSMNIFEQWKNVVSNSKFNFR